MINKYFIYSAIFYLFWASFADPAYANCSVPNALANGQVADASQVMDNFNAVAQCAGAAVQPSGTPERGAIAVFGGSQSVTSGNLAGDVTTSGGTTTTLSSTGVTPGSYANPNITIDAKGRITAAVNGNGAGGASFSYGMPTGGGFAVAASSRAAKGNIVQPVSNVIIASIMARLGSKVSGATYKAWVATISGGVISSILASSNEYTAINSAAEQIKFDLTALVALNANTEYAFIVGRTDGYSTYSLPLMYVNSGEINYPSGLFWYKGYTQTDVAVENGAAVVTSSSTNGYLIGFKIYGD